MTTVLIDGWHLAGFGATRGFGRYLRGLLAELAQDPRIDARVLVTPAGIGAVGDGITAEPIHRIVPGKFAELEHRVRLPLDIGCHRSAVFHSPGQEPPRWCGRAWVQTLHDVPLSFSEANLSDELRMWQKRRARVRYAHGVVAVSRYVADRAIALLGLDSQRVHVAHHGVDMRFSPDPDQPPGHGAPGRDEPYILFVSEYGPHKGYREAFAVIDELAAMGLPHRLVMVGRLAPWWRPVVDELIGQSRHPERIQLAGLADDEALVRWYRGADCLIVTSRAEGFGMPVVEAMACGVPVVAFDNTALPEVIDHGGQLVPDGDVVALAATVGELLRTPNQWREWSMRAYQRSRAFSWGTSAATHIEVYEEALARRRTRT